MLYLIYDGRYHMDKDSALVMSTCSTLKEALEERTDYGKDCVIEENEHKNGTLIPTGKVW